MLSYTACKSFIGVACYLFSSSCELVKNTRTPLSTDTETDTYKWEELIRRCCFLALLLYVISMTSIDVNALTKSIVGPCVVRIVALGLFRFDLKQPVEA